MSRRYLKQAVRALLVLGSGLVLGALAVAISWSARPGDFSPASAASKCTASGTTASIVLASQSTSTTTTSVTVAVVTPSTSPTEKELMVTIDGGTPSICGGAIGSTTTTLNFALASSPASAKPTADTIILDQTGNYSTGTTTYTTDAFPASSTLAITGTVGDSGTTSTVQINGAAGDGITVGTSTLDPTGAGSTTSSLSGVSKYVLVGNGAVTLSAQGDNTDPVASTVPVYFQAGLGAETFKPASPSNTIDFSQITSCSSTSTSCTLTVNDSGSALTSPALNDGLAQLSVTTNNNSVTDYSYDFSAAETDVTTWLGIPRGPTSFYGQAGTYTLSSLQPNSQVVAASAGDSESYTVAASSTVFKSGTGGADTFTVTGNNNTFDATTPGPDKFYDTVPNGLTPSNLIDFSNVSTSASGGTLSINDSGGLVTVGGQNLSNGHAAVGAVTSTPSYTFLDGPSSPDSSNFTSIIGSTGGNTDFMVGGTAGLTLIGRGAANSTSTGNSVAFLTGNGVAVNESGSQVTLSSNVLLGASTKASGFVLGSGQVLVSPPSGVTSCSAAVVCDTLESELGNQSTPSVTPPAITTVTGPSAGYSTFYAGAGPESYNFSDGGSKNTFVGGSGFDTFTGGGNQNTYVAGSGGGTFSESASPLGASNEIDFSGVPVGSQSGCTSAPCSLTVNVSGGTGTYLATVLNSAQVAVASYGFSSGGQDFTTLIGAQGGRTTFDGGVGNYTYTGQGTGNTLDFSQVPQGSASTLSFDVTQEPTPLATLNGATKEPFSGITNLVGLAGGGTTFVGGSTGGYTFHGNGNSGNEADFTAQGPSTTLQATVNDPNSASTPLTGGTVTFSLNGGSVLCASVPVSVSGSTGTASCSTSSLPTGTDRVLAEYTPPSGSGLLGSDFILTPSGSAGASAPTTSLVDTSPTTGLSDQLNTTLSANVSIATTANNTPIAAGTVTFSQAGGSTLCTAAVPGGSTTTEPVSCTATLPDGSYDVVAVYQPSDSSVSGSVADPVSISVNSSEQASSFVVNTINAVSTGNLVDYETYYSNGNSYLNCNGYSFALDCAYATVSGQANPYGGTVTFSIAGSSTPLCIDSIPASLSATQVTCSPYNSFYDVYEGQEIVAEFAPNSPGADQPVYSSAVAESPPATTTLFNFSVNGTTTAMQVNGSASTTSVVDGLPATLSATVTSTGNGSDTPPNLPGGQVIFSTAGGGTLCSASVPSASTTASVECSVTFSSAGYQDILATYIPSSGVVYPSAGTIGGTGLDQPIQVTPPAATVTTGSYVQNTQPQGVVANLSTASTTTSPAPVVAVDCTSGPCTTTNATVAVSVGGSQVLVAAPPWPFQGLGSPYTAACSGSASFCDTVSGATIVNGSSGGNNTFVAGSNTSETFGDTGTVGNDTVDFSKVPTGNGSLLTVNASGGPVTLPSNVVLQNDYATNGTITDQFTTTNANIFTNFIGSSSSGGNTSYYAGGTGGYSFTATGTNDSIDFSTAPGITVQYSSAVDGTVTGLTGSGTDQINGLTTITGSRSGGNKFTAPTSVTNSSATNYSFTANDDSTHMNVRNTFTGGDGTDTFTSNGNNNVFMPGIGNATISDAGSGNTVDFSNVGNQVTVDVAGVQVAPAPYNDSAVAGTSTYDFRSFGTTPAIFKGPSQGATFYAGSVGDTFDGAASAVNPNELSFAHASASPLVICLVTNTSGCSADEAVVGGGATTEPFNSNITIFDGLPNGNTTFVAGDPDNRTFNASGSNNAADFSGASAGVSVDLSAGTTGTVANGNGTDHISGLTTVTGYALGSNNFTGGSASYTFTGNGTGNVLNAGSGATVFNGNGGSDTLNAGSGTDVFTVTGSGGGSTFTAGAGADTFTGSGDANTFIGGSGTDHFTAPGNNNIFKAGSGPDTISDTPGTGSTIDFGAVKTSTGTPLVVNLTNTPVSVTDNGVTVSNVASDTAQAGTVTYDFTSGGPNFKDIDGSSYGNTYFSAHGSSGGYTIQGSGPANAADFSANLCGITAEMASTTNNVILPSGTGCSTTASDTLTGVTRVIGAPQGTNTFDADLSGNNFTAASSDNTLSYAGMTALAGTTGVTVNLNSGTVTRAGYSPDLFSFSPGTLTIVGSPGNDNFQVGTASVNLQGGGGTDSLDLSHVPAPSSGTAGVNVDLDAGVISPSANGPAIGGVDFTSGCGSAADLCIGSVTGSSYDDTYVANSGTLSLASPIALNGNGGNDTLNLSAISGPATVDMPITTGNPNVNAAICSIPSGLTASTGRVCPGAGQSPDLLFTRVANLVGTGNGGDYIFPGSGTESLSEVNAAGTLDYSVVPSPTNTSTPPTTTGITVNAQDVGGSFQGTVTSPPTIGLSDSFSDIGTFIGTRDNDTFIQSGPGNYDFVGGAGANSLDLSQAPTGTTVNLTAPAAGDNCTPGIQNNDGNASGNGVSDTFTCMNSVLTNSAEYQVAPGHNATINGGGSGVLRLVSTTSDMQTPNCGVTVTMPVGATPGSVQSNGCGDYNFSFTGISTVYGTNYNDLFYPGSANVTIHGNGGTDGISYDTPRVTSAVVVNLSTTLTYTVPAGEPTAGTRVPPNTAIGGNGGTVTLDAISNAIATPNFDDVLVGGPGAGSLFGESGNDRFVPTGGTYVINGGSGSDDTIDLSQINGYTYLDLGSSAAQYYMGTNTPTLTLTPGTIKTAIASPAGSSLQAGNGDGYLLEGSGHDWMKAGTGNQTLIGNGVGNTLIGGSGTDTLQGGTYPVTFEPGDGADTLVSQTTENTLSYQDEPYPFYAVKVNLFNQQVTIPPGEPGAGNTLPAQTATDANGGTAYLAGAGISKVVGSPLNDIFVTGSTASNISGNGGDDLFVVMSGGNTLTAANGSASRFLIAGPGTGGTNVIQGGGNSWIDYSQAQTGATVNLQTGSASGGFTGATETLSGVLNIEGSQFQDFLYAAAPYATVIGLNGGDTLYASPYGRDLLESDGNGNDTFCDAAGCGGMTTNPTSGSTLVGGSGADTFFARNFVQDTIDGGGGFNKAQIDTIDEPTTSNIASLLP